jgi:hypothetical protein
MMTKGAQIVRLGALFADNTVGSGYWMLSKTLDSALHNPSRS